MSRKKDLSFLKNPILGVPSVTIAGEPITPRSSSNKRLWACLKLKNYIQALSMY